MARKQSSRTLLKFVPQGSKGNSNEPIPNIPFFHLLVIQSRILCVWIPSIVFNYLIPDHDADAFKGIVPAEDSKMTTADAFVQKLFGGLRQWDGRHFMHIAQFGYTYENNLAFFPLFPLLVRMVTSFWYSLLIPYGSLRPENALILTAAFINLGAFLGAGYVLFRLTLCVWKDVRKAYLSLIIFCINPASIFFTAAYSESLFALFTWLGLYCLHRRSQVTGQGVLESGVAFALALLTRANGLLNIGFIGFTLGGPFLAELFNISVSSSTNRRRDWLRLFGLPILGVVALLTVMGPWAYHQYAIFNDFCRTVGGTYVPSHVRLLANDQGYVLPGQLNRLPWCHRWLPLSYAYIQAHYWQVGFLEYFQPRKLPNFLLAAPVFILCFQACLGPLVRVINTNVAVTLKDARSLLPYVLHVVALAVTGLFFANIEVTTRIVFSASPLLYWYAADVLAVALPDHASNAAGENLMESRNLFTIIANLWTTTSDNPGGKLILLYSLIYMLLGTALHVNFLPWT